MSQPKLSVFIVVKNEVDKISKALDSIKDLADELIVIDTGSTDGTIPAANKWAVANGAVARLVVESVGSRFHDADGDFNFGAAKQHGIDIARCDWVMWIDANDYVENGKALREAWYKTIAKNQNCYIVLPTYVSDTFSFPRARLGRKDQAAIEGRVHEFMYFPEDVARIELPFKIHNRKKSRDLERNRKLLEKDWRDYPTGRTAFYLGMTCMELNKQADAFVWFRRRCRTFEFQDEFKEEYYKSLEMQAAILGELVPVKGATLEDLRDISYEMIGIEPNRREGHYYAAVYYMATREWKKAEICIKRAIKLKKPDGLRLWVNPKMYDDSLIRGAIEKCVNAARYGKVLKPDAILDYGPKPGVMRRGNAQYNPF